MAKKKGTKKQTSYAPPMSTKVPLVGGKKK